MAFFSEPRLELLGLSESARRRADLHLFESREEADLTIFLSHSHRDRLAAKGIVTYMAGLGIDVYVDWNDSSLPRETNASTAIGIKQRIRQTNLFVVLATRNAMNSRWVAWEIGVADATKGQSRVLIIPVSDSNGNFRGTEYIQVYRRVELSSFGLAHVKRPQGNLTESTLKRFFDSLLT